MFWKWFGTQLVVCRHLCAGENVCLSCEVETELV